MRAFNKFELSYLETALWSSVDDEGIPLDDSKYADLELAEETKQQIQNACEAFQNKIQPFLDLLDASVINSLPNHFAHDFWLTRNGHGAGFWDGDYPEPIGQFLTGIAHSFGEVDLYIGDDGLLYQT